jgi:hypothetical protein
MRRFGLVLGCSALALLAFGVVGGNAQQGKKGFGMGGMGMAGFGKMDPLTLLRNADVKKELDLSEEQLEKIPAAAMKAAAEVLNDKQMKRFRQIELQVRGVQAFVKDESLRSKLMISESQTKNIQEILADEQREITEMQKENKGKGGFGGGNFEKMQAIQKESKEKIMGVLTSDQKKSYKEMIGDEFKFTPFQFGKKKADTE